MVHHRDVGAFDERAPRYEYGWLGRLHQEIADRTAHLVLTCVPEPRRVLDVGCGTGYLLRQLATQIPAAHALVGIDAAHTMVALAQRATSDDRLRFSTGTAEHLPYPAATFDLVVSTTSFDHWADQRAGLAECARVMTPDGHLVLTDQFSSWLLPTLLLSRRGKARTKSRATHLLTEAGLMSPEWHNLYAVIIRTVIVRK
jgi:ubiquinone/menaquinone biosynthesis C-methylase UbiE